MSGPLSGIRVVEVGGIGPAPHCGMILADMGADVVRIDRPGPADPGAPYDLLNRNKRSIALDLKTQAGIEAARNLIDKADIVTEGYRPGVMEKLGLGPEIFTDRNPRLIYGRMTGWGQDGPLAPVAGHDINYIAITGALHALGRKGESPPVPLNLVGDFGGGSLYLVVGLLAALHEAQRSGRGQVVDCAIVDGVNNLLAMQHGMLQDGVWRNEREANLIDGGAPFYRTYETSDGRYVAVGAVEPKFYDLLIEAIGIDPASMPAQWDRKQWPAVRERFATIFAGKSRDEWCALLEGSDASVLPVLDFAEAREHPHVQARDIMVDAFGLRHPAPAPRFSRTPSSIRSGPSKAGEDGVAIASDWSTGAQGQRPEAFSTARRT